MISSLRTFGEFFHSFIETCEWTLILSCKKFASIFTDLFRWKSSFQYSFHRRNLLHSQKLLSFLSSSQVVEKNSFPSKKVAEVLSLQLAIKFLLTDSFIHPLFYKLSLFTSLTLAQMAFHLFDLLSSFCTKTSQKLQLGA